MARQDSDSGGSCSSTPPQSPVDRARAVAAAAARAKSAAADPTREQTGTLRVLLMKGIDLKAADSIIDGGKSDPYVILKCGGQELKSSVVKKNLNPQWNETLDFSGKLSDFLASDLMLTVMDKDWYSKDDPLGDGTVSLHIQELKQPSAIEKEVELSIKGKQKGKVVLRVSWIPTPAAPTTPVTAAESAAAATADPSRDQKGTLKIILKEGIDLKAADVNGKSDPYVIVKCGGQEIKSSVVQRSLNPKWNETLTIYGKMSDFLATDIIVRVYDKDTFSKDDPLGDATVGLHIQELKTLAVLEKEAHLAVKGKQKGRLLLAVSWIPTPTVPATPKTPRTPAPLLGKLAPNPTMAKICLLPFVLIWAPLTAVMLAGTFVGFALRETPGALYIAYSRRSGIQVASDRLRSY